MAPPRLTAAAHALLSAIAAGSRGGSFVGSNAQLIAATGYSPSAIERGLALLEQRGHIARAVRGKIRRILLLAGAPADLPVNPGAPARMTPILDGEPRFTVKNEEAFLPPQGCGGTGATPEAPTDCGPPLACAGASGRAEGISLLPGIQSKASRPGFAGGREGSGEGEQDRPRIQLEESPELRAHRLAAAVAKAKASGFPWAEDLPDLAAEWGVPGAAVLAGLRLALRRYRQETNLRKLRGVVMRLDAEELTRADLIAPSPAAPSPPPTAAPPATPEAAAAEQAELREVLAQIRSGIPASTQAKVAEDLERARAPGRSKQPPPPPARSREEVLRELEARSRAASNP